MQVELKNTTKKLCVIGDPVLHSKSPLLQNAMLQALGLDYIYLCQPVKAGEAARWLEAAKTAGYAGFNATMPHKEDLLPLMDVLDEDARLYRSVNTVCIKDDKVYGYNTDGQGFLQALLDAGFDPRGRRVVLLGAGGAAKAVALKLAQQRVASVTICNRTLALISTPSGPRPPEPTCWSTVPPWAWRGQRAALRTSPFWRPCPPARRCTTSSTPPPRPPFWLGPGPWGIPPSTA